MAFVINCDSNNRNVHKIRKSRLHYIVNVNDFILNEVISLQVDLPCNSEMYDCDQ